ncbi:MAG: hypothetical protein Q4E37_04940 [Tissierellia bacterium]|nr:hypothetical protein [Tissierellia bacterium]
MLIKYKTIDYYQCFQDMFERLLENERLIYEFLLNFDGVQIKEVQEVGQKMYLKNQEAYLALLKDLDNDFIPPMDREDIHDLAHRILGLHQAIQAISSQVYMYRVKDMPRASTSLARESHQIIQDLVGTFKKFQDFGRNDYLKERIGKIYSQLDPWEDRYIHFIHQQFSFREDLDPRKVFGWVEFARAYKKAIDKAKDLVFIMERILLKYH